MRATYVAAIGAILACGFEPSAPVHHYVLNEAYMEAKNEDLVESPVARAQLEGALEFLTGTPSAPGLRPRKGRLGLH